MASQERTRRAPQPDGGKSVIRVTVCTSCRPDLGRQLFCGGALRGGGAIFAEGIETAARCGTIGKAKTEGEFV